MNNATRTIVAVLGTIFGLSGMNHGFFEILQGNIPTGGVFISAIGEAHKMWPHGNEMALTLIPNFLISGIAGVTVGLALIIWSLGFVHHKPGPAILLLLFILLLLVGGGIAQVLFFPWIYLVSTHIHRPLSSWKKILPARVLDPLSKLWLGLLTMCAALWVVALVIATTGFVPGVSDPETVLTLMLIGLGLQIVVLPLTFISGFAHDLGSGADNALAKTLAMQGN